MSTPMFATQQGGRAFVVAPGGAKSDPGCFGPDSGLGCEALCLEPTGAAVTEGSLAYVGPGAGNYEMVQNIQYVGPGGSYDRERIVSYSGWKCRLWCILCMVFLLLIGIGLLVWMLLPSQDVKVEEDVRAISLAFDCDEGYWNWEKGWSQAKQDWCCYHRARGCATTSVMPYDCDAGFSTWTAGWSLSKKHWCCHHYNKGCIVSQPYDCDAGFSKWQAGWSAGKKDWCCTHHRRGCVQEKSCSLWGDPHIFTFDESRLVFYSTGDFWIVKSSTLKVQGRFEATDWTKENDKTDYSSMTAMVVSGPIIDGRKIQVGVMDSGKITCDRYEILKYFGSAKCGRATVTYDDKGALVDSAMAFLPHKVVHLYLPGGVKIQFNRWPNFANAKITMQPVTGQTGICGDFNGVKKEGVQAGKELHAQFGYGVPLHELLFPSPIALNIPKALPSDKRCPYEKRKRAETICHHQLQSSHGWSMAECLGDVCDAHTTGIASLTAMEMKAKFHR